MGALPSLKGPCWVSGSNRVHTGLIRILSWGLVLEDCRIYLGEKAGGRGDSDTVGGRNAA